MRKVSKDREKDDTLFGLLSSYKAYCTYFRVLENKELDEIILILVSNPAKWNNIPHDMLEGFVEVRRLKLGLNKMSLKYLLPEHLVAVLGDSLGIKIPKNKRLVMDNIESEGYYILKTDGKNIPGIITGLEKIINLKPRKKYEILEKSFIKD